MLFTSLQYALFLPFVVFLYWRLPQDKRLIMLLIASYLFYMSWMPVFILLIFPLTVFNYFYGKLLIRVQSKRKLIFGIGVAANLLVLSVFKYANFFADNAGAAMRALSLNAPDWSFNIILPLGISFFVFEFIHYLFELYRGNKPIDSFVTFALFAAFFPTQIAGPIKRYPDFVTQMQSNPPLRLTYFDEGLPLIVIGLGKKVLLADTLANFVQMGFSQPGAFGAIELWLFAFAFAFQIYFDFSGYTDIARGSAMLFGYHIPINFNMPYIASSISDFWRRWHISLSTWLRDYLFIPLGGSRTTRLKVHRNLLLTMTLGGLWHGASWNFVVWGVYHGLLLCVHKEVGELKKSVVIVDRFIESPAGRAFSTIITFLAVCIGWVFFRMQDMHLALPMVRKMVTLHPLTTSAEAGQLLVLSDRFPVIVPIAIIMVCLLLVVNFPLSHLNEKGILRSTPPALKSAFCVAILLALAILSPDNSHPFIYFQF